MLNNENQYVFLNRQFYTPLSQAGWNYILRKIFIEARIPIDKKTRNTNLNHKFRHAFAMNLIKIGAKDYELQKALRHRNVNSCRVYYNPDDNDKAGLLMINNERSYYNDDQK